MRNLIHLLSIIMVFFVVSCQEAVDDVPKIKVFTMDSVLLPLFVYVDDTCVGIARSIPVLTEPVDDGTMSPSFGAEGTVSVEVSEGKHTVVATKDFLSAHDVPADYRSNITDALTFVQLTWTCELDVVRNLQYPIRIGRKP